MDLKSVPRPPLRSSVPRFPSSPSGHRGSGCLHRPPLRRLALLPSRRLRVRLVCSRRRPQRRYRACSSGSASVAGVPPGTHGQNHGTRSSRHYATLRRQALDAARSSHSRAARVSRGGSAAPARLATSSLTASAAASPPSTQGGRLLTALAAAVCWPPTWHRCACGAPPFVSRHSTSRPASPPCRLRPTLGPTLCGALHPTARAR